MSRPGKNQGEQNFKNKLKVEEVVEIYHDQNLTQHELAKKFGVSQSTINHIKRGRTWGFIEYHKFTQQNGKWVKHE